MSEQVMVIGADDPPASCQLAFPTGNFLPGLPGVLARPVALVADTSAELLALPGRLVGLMTRAEQTLAAAHTAVTRTTALLDRVEPTVRRLTDTTGPDQVEALVTLIDRLPELAGAMDHDVLPLLGRLDQLSPDIHHVLDGVSQVNRMVHRLPKVFRRHHTSAAHEVR